MSGPDALVALAWPAALTIGGLVTLIVALVAFGFWRQPSAIAELGTALIEAHVLSRIIGVLIIVPAIFGLGLVDKISGAEAIAALSGIAGYILGAASTMLGAAMHGPKA